MEVLKIAVVRVKTFHFFSSRNDSFGMFVPCGSAIFTLEWLSLRLVLSSEIILMNNMRDGGIL